MQQDLDLDDVLTLEGTIETDDVNYFVTLQRAINSGLWQLQGSVGRTMMAAIKGGSCMLGETAHKDAYGNTVPARTDVRAGTAGSYEFVVQTRGLEWAERMASAGETSH